MSRQTKKAIQALAGAPAAEVVAGIRALAGRLSFRDRWAAKKLLDGVALGPAAPETKQEARVLALRIFGGKAPEAATEKKGADAPPWPAPTEDDPLTPEKFSAEVASRAEIAGRGPDAAFVRAVAEEWSAALMPARVWDGHEWVHEKADLYTWFIATCGIRQMAARLVLARARGNPGFAGLGDLRWAAGQIDPQTDEEAARLRGILLATAGEKEAEVLRAACEREGLAVEPFAAELPAGPAKPARSKRPKRATCRTDPSAPMSAPAGQPQAAQAQAAPARPPKPAVPEKTYLHECDDCGRLDTCTFAGEFLLCRSCIGRSPSGKGGSQSGRQAS